MDALPKSTSAKMELNHVDWKKTGRMLLVLLAGQALTFGTDFLLNLDFGVYTALVGSLVSLGVELARRYLTDHSQ